MFDRSEANSWREQTKVEANCRSVVDEWRRRHPTTDFNVPISDAVISRLFLEEGCESGCKNLGDFVSRHLGIPTD